MEQKQTEPQEEQPFHPNMFWEGFFYLSFFVFFCIVLIPNTPKALSFDRFYPLALITYGIAGLICGAVAFRILKNAPAWMKFTVTVSLHVILIYYLIKNVENFGV